MKTFLCIEHGEEFLLDAKDMDHAREEAMCWGAEVMFEVKVLSRDGNRVEFIDPRKK